jgi:hypothetical protein
MTSVFSSLPNAASTAATDSGRFTDIGMICEGNSTAIRSGSIGYALVGVAESVITVFLQTSDPFQQFAQAQGERR